MKTALYLSIVLILILIGLVIFNVIKEQPWSKDNEPDSSIVEQSPEEYFKEHIVTRGITDIGQPIEGFDAETLMLAYPGLTPSDFAEVATLEGRYEMTTGELVFVRNEEQPATSAERTLSGEGHMTLLANLSTRLGITPDSIAAVNSILEAINTVERVSAGIGGRATALGITVTPLAVLEDSRCPIGVTCIQAGTVRIRAMVDGPDGSSEIALTLGEPARTGDMVILFGQVEPVAESGVTIDESDYSFSFQISR